MSDVQIGERVARMETELQYIKRDMNELKDDVADIKAKQDQLISLLTEANGMRKLMRWLWGGGVIIAGIGLTYWSSIKSFLAKIGA